MGKEMRIQLQVTEVGSQTFPTPSRVHGSVYFPSRSAVLGLRDLKLMKCLAGKALIDVSIGRYMSL